jgi:hypothetical protein
VDPRYTRYTNAEKIKTYKEMMFGETTVSMGMKVPSSCIACDPTAMS